MEFFKDLSTSQNKILFQQIKVEWTYSSNAIEGNSLTLADTQFIIESGLTVKGKSIKEHNEVIGHSRAIDLIYNMLDKSSFNKKDIFTLHQSILTEIVVDIYAPVGAWKNEDNGRYITVNDKSEYLPYPGPDTIEHLMNLWLNYFNENLETKSLDKALEVYTNLHLSFSSIHPLFDGNGRLARLLANIPLLKSGFLPLVIKQENRQEYIKVLSSYQMESDSLDSNSNKLVQNNEQYKDVLSFFKEEYGNIQSLVDSIKK